MVPRLPSPLCQQRGDLEVAIISCIVTVSPGHPTWLVSMGKDSKTSLHILKNRQKCVKTHQSLQSSYGAPESVPHKMPSVWKVSAPSG